MGIPLKAEITTAGYSPSSKDFPPAETEQPVAISDALTLLSGMVNNPDFQESHEAGYGAETPNIGATCPARWGRTGCRSICGCPCPGKKPPFKPPGSERHIGIVGRLPESRSLFPRQTAAKREAFMYARNS